MLGMCKLPILNRNQVFKLVLLSQCCLMFEASLGKKGILLSCQNKMDRMQNEKSTTFIEKTGYKEVP